MIRRLILWVLSYAWLLVLLGVGLLGAGAYYAYTASHGGGVPEESALTVVDGYAAQAREVTEERRRRTGTSTRRYFEIDLKPAAGGQTIQLRMPEGVTRQHLMTALEENIRVKYDPDDKNTAYDIALLVKGNASPRPIVTYETISQRAIADAAKDRDTLTSPAMLGFSLALTLLGACGIWLRRRMLKADEALETA